MALYRDYIGSLSASFDRSPTTPNGAQVSETAARNEDTGRLQTQQLDRRMDLKTGYHPTEGPQIH